MEEYLTVFFEEPFWVGVFERLENGKLSACRVVFGAEPKDCEVWDFVLTRHGELEFGPLVDASVRKAFGSLRSRQRKAGKELERTGIGTKSQQALQRQREEKKTERKEITREQREAEKQRQFDLKQQKRKEKRRGH